MYSQTQFLRKFLIIKFLTVLFLHAFFVIKPFFFVSHFTDILTSLFSDLYLCKMVIFTFKLDYD